MPGSVLVDLESVGKLMWSLLVSVLLDYSIPTLLSSLYRRILIFSTQSVTSDIQRSVSLVRYAPSYFNGIYRATLRVYQWCILNYD